MIRKFCSPSRYIQGQGVLGEIGTHIKVLGGKPMLISGPNSFRSVEASIAEAFHKADMEYDVTLYRGECCESSIRRVCDSVREKGNDMIVGIGGGRILDTAKAVSYYSDLPLVIAPTSAATDAPCSALSVLYTEEGVFDKYLFLKTNPAIVLVDSKVVAEAPGRLIVAGMGDAFATYFEARAVQNAGKKNQVQGFPTIAGFKMAEACYQTLMQYGVAAKADLEAGRCTQAVENIIEANTYLSGVGFESGGLGAAHAIQKGLTVIEELHDILHGEKVAFCVIAQLIMEGVTEQELDQAAAFYQAVGLPLCFADMGLESISTERVRAIAEKSCAAGSTIYNMPVEVTIDGVTDAILKADEYGRKKR